MRPRSMRHSIKSNTLQRCSSRIWRTGLLASPIRAHISCSETPFLFSKLALAESNFTPDEHIDTQVALARKGFLRNRVRAYGASPDGQFGPNTRAAIKDFQRSIGTQSQKDIVKPPPGHGTDCFATERGGTRIIPAPSMNRTRGAAAYGRNLPPQKWLLCLEFVS